jgi:hypothetical protein
MYLHRMPHNETTSEQHACQYDAHSDEVKNGMQTACQPKAAHKLTCSGFVPAPMFPLLELLSPSLLLLLLELVLSAASSSLPLLRLTARARLTSRCGRPCVSAFISQADSFQGAITWPSAGKLSC